jgi:hypothetical protein
MLSITHKNNNMTVVRSYVSVFTQTAGGTRRWKVPPDNMKHTRYGTLMTIMENYQQQHCLDAAFSLSLTLRVSPDSCGLSSFGNSETLSHIIITSREC